MKISKILIFLLFITIIISCDDETPKSNQNQIINFKFSALTPEVVGTIDESTKLIAVSVPNGTAVNALTPTIEISEGAQISPASDVAVNFSNPVVYTVTAEDGSTQEYLVTVTELESNEKKILSFKLNLTPEVSGTINEATKKVTLLVPNALNVATLAPVVEVSPEATVVPTSGTVVDFTAPAIYTVTAEDGTQQAYEVTVSLDPNVNFTIDAHIGSTEIAQAGYLLVKGTNFGTEAANVKVVWTNQANQATVDITTFVIVNNTSIGLLLPETMPLGQYKVKVVINNQQLTMPETFTVVLPAPQITLVDKASVERGQNLQITGKYFQASGNIVKLSKENTSYTLDIVSETTTSIEVTIPNSVPVDVYTLNVTSNDKTTFYNTQTITVTLPPTTPIITNIDKFSYSLGETMVITGQNLKKQGFATNINFIPFLGGTTIVRSAVVNDEGTEVTFLIPNDFPKASYSILIEVDFEVSEEYGEIIQIKQ
ncbi:hypothetical protein SanaruYs_23000 [Chryseotalea sanaruensis]|uniref:Uncharacterized protein n=1 Tax=Chryseotalea sanaruensis TaxID=2482724 RepID=A0A401UAX9_9BACT|nr:DUF5018 domain-containing protein [Chryseotalea sanaruensis]GCC52068.1 hypothetical protein SanaruYs_23000 [Chryseotalea sanaruensis]